MKSIKIINEALGPVLIVRNAYIQPDALILIVNPNGATTIPSDDINNVVSSAFIYIVNKFIKDNEIDFNPDGSFESIDHRLVPAQDYKHVCGLWEFKITGSITDPLEYFINHL